MNIIIDLDNVLFDNTVVTDICTEAGIEPPRHWDLHDLPKEIQEKCWNAFKDKNLMCYLKPYPQAIGIDIKLKEAGHKVFVVTARSSNLHDETKAMVVKHFPFVDDIVLVGDWDKTETYKKLKADVVIDDHVEHIYQAISVDVKYPILVSNDTTPYNHASVEVVVDRGGFITSSVQSLEHFAKSSEMTRKRKK